MRARLLAACLLVLAAAAPAAGAATPRLTAADRAEITSVLERYVPAALERRDLRLAYELSGPQVRGGQTLAQWLHGGVAVYPYRTRDRDFSGWSPTYVLPGIVGLGLVLHPAAGTHEPLIAFDVEMAKIDGQWRVNAFNPGAIISPGSVFSHRDLLPSGATVAPGKARLSHMWLLAIAIPFGLLIVGLPVGLFGVARIRERRAERAYLASRTADG